MLSSASLFATSLLCISQALAAPTTANIESTPNIGYATSDNLNTGIYRDGGGGGCVNGLCVVGFSDTTICNGQFQTSGSTALSDTCKAEGGAMGFNSFAHNTFATFDTADRGSQPNAPNALYDFGNHDGQNGELVGPTLGAVTPEESALGANFAIWPNSNMVPLSAGIGSSDVVGVFNALSTDGTTLYNTMAKITVTDDVANNANMPAERIVPQLFQANENLYGTYAVMAGHGDNYLYLFSRTESSGIGPSSIKVARVPQASLTDKSQYQYWDGSTWSATQPSTTDTASNIVSSSGFMDTGEFWWSDKFNSYVHVSASYGAFTISYSDSLTSGWSDPQTLYTATLPEGLDQGSEKIMYAGHAYPDWDASGNSLLLSWTCDEMWTQMAVVHFG